METNTGPRLITSPEPELTADDRCPEHRAYWANYCPVCGTARVITDGRAQRFEAWLAADPRIAR